MSGRSNLTRGAHRGCPGRVATGAPRSDREPDYVVIPAHAVSPGSVLPVRGSYASALDALPTGVGGGGGFLNFGLTLRHEPGSQALRQCPERFPMLVALHPQRMEQINGTNTEVEHWKKDRRT